MHVEFRDELQRLGRESEIQEDPALQRLTGCPYRPAGLYGEPRGPSERTRGGLCRKVTQNCSQS